MNKLLLFTLVAISLSACQTSKMIVPANASVELDYNMSKGFTTDLRNCSDHQIDISVLQEANESQVSQFGLNKKGEASISVDENCKLVITNNSNKAAKVRYQSNENIAISAVDPGREYIRFTLANTSANSIPLIIPTVMNPNLSPYSESGVDLAIGQEILYKSGARKYVILVVDDSIQDGAVIDMAPILQQKKKEWGIE